MTANNNDKPAKEKVATSADYGGAKIHITNLGNYLVQFAGLSYPANPNSLAGAKQIIDDANKAKEN